MKDKNKQDMEQMILDAIIERPITCTIGKEFLYIYPPSVGITILSSEIVKRIKFDNNLLLVSEYFELLRVCMEHREDIIRLVAIHTFENRKDALFEEKVCERMEKFKSLDNAEILTLFVAIMQWNSHEDKFIKHLGLDKEKKRRERIQSVKKDKSTMTFGGLSLYGTLLDFAAERYGYSVEYILWGLSATNLHMMIQDSVQSVYLSDKERKKAGISTDGIVVNADDKKASKEAVMRLVKQINHK